MPPLAEITADLNRIAARRPDLAKAIQRTSANLNGKRPLQEDDDISSSEDDDAVIYYKWDCNQIRTKINRLIRSGEMKVTEFQRKLDIKSNSYGRFVKLKGPHSGCDNQTYKAATRYFLRREAMGVSMPRSKKAKPEDMAKFSVDGIHLDGEETGEVTIYDTCDDLGSKIQAHLRNSGITQAALCREIGSMYDPPRNIQSKQMADFLNKKGPIDGCESVVYYGGYVYFEKLRIRNGANKSKKRLDVERVQPLGMTRKRCRGYWCGPGMTIVEDQFGRARTVLERRY